MELLALSAAIQVTRMASSIALELRRLVEVDQTLESNLKNGLDVLETEVAMVTAKFSANPDKFLGPVQEALLVHIQDVLHDVEDFLLRLRRPGSISRKMHLMVGKDRRSTLVNEIDQYKERIKLLRELKVDEASEDAEPCTFPTDEYIPESELVGIANRRAELLHMLPRKCAKQHLTVVCIAGRRGVGKTTLARAIYDHLRAGGDYKCIAWVVASDCRDTSALLRKMFDSVRAASVSGGTLPEILASQRFLLVIDDIREAQLWHGIKELFLEDRNSSSIVITTNVKSVASSCKGQLFVVEGLSDAYSKELFWKKVQVTQSAALNEALGRVFDTCEGTPLALVSVANHFLLKGKAILTVKDCEEEGLALGRYFTGQDRVMPYDKIRRSLGDCYNKLPDYVHRMCLLSICMFPKGYKVKRKSLARELIASGLIAGGDVRLNKEKIASSCMEKLMEQNLIEPLTIGLDYEVKRFVMCGIMLEFVIHKAAKQNFATLIHNDDRVPTDSIPSNHVRRLSVDGGTEKVRMLVGEVGLSAVRWLRICNSKVLLDFENCKMLRVLDLEGSTGVDNRVMVKVCQLQFLHYLGLRRTDVDMVPRSIKKLSHLETLDCRETSVKALPIEVFSLPQLAYLFGHFELPRSSKKRVTLEHLHTLAGVVINDWDAFDQTMRQAGNQLTKLKIWCAIPTPQGTPSFTQRIQDHVKQLKSLAVDSNHLCDQSFSLLTRDGSILTLKLRGTLVHLPDAADLRSLQKLSELHLVDSDLSCEDLSKLQELPCLVYLKLAQSNGFGHGLFTCQKDGFQSLQRLCFEAPKLPEMVIEHGGMPCLSTLELLCLEYSPIPKPTFMSKLKRAERFAGIVGLLDLDNMKELILHRDTSVSKLKKWKKGLAHAKSRPSVKRQLRD